MPSTTFDLSGVTTDQGAADMLGLTLREFAQNIRPAVATARALGSRVTNVQHAGRTFQATRIGASTLYQVQELRDGLASECCKSTISRARAGEGPWSCDNCHAWVTETGHLVQPAAVSCIQHGRWGQECGPACREMTKAWNDARKAPAMPALDVQSMPNREWTIVAAGELTDDQAASITFRAEPRQVELAAFVQVVDAGGTRIGHVSKAELIPATWTAPAVVVVSIELH